MKPNDLYKGKELGMTELEFCEHWCGELEPNQKKMMEHKVKEGSFLGVGRPIGGMRFMPLVSIGKTVNVIDGAGYYQLAAFDGRRGY